jgi:hypothetical protein
VFSKLTFIRPMTVPPLLDITGAGRGNLKLESREVDFIDADAQDPAPTLASHGFGAVPFSASPPTGEIDPAYRKYFANLCAEAVRQATGAPLAVGSPMAVQIRQSGAANQEAPISVCHTDFTPGSTAVRVAEVLELIGRKTLRPARFAVFNTWWLARSGPQDRPLALCDATSVAAPDLQIGRAQVLAPDKSAMDYGEIALQRYSARHRWYWYPKLGPDRLLLFCGFDSDSSRPSMVTHASFANPECPAGAPPRLSVECRCFAFW